MKAGRANDGRNGEWRRRALPAGRNIFVCGGEPSWRSSIGGGDMYRRPGFDSELKNFILNGPSSNISKHGSRDDEIRCD